MVVRKNSVGENLTELNERRRRPRFTLNAPLTIVMGNRTISGYTRNVSDRGVYFYLDPDCHDIDDEFEFVLELPPDITLSNWCPIRCKGRLVRKDQTSSDLTGIAAEILQYSIPAGTA